MPRTRPQPRLAFLIGSSEGIGLALARQLAGSGTRVVLFGRSEGKLAAALGSLPGARAGSVSHPVPDAAGSGPAATAASSAAGTVGTGGAGGAGGTGGAGGAGGVPGAAHPAGPADPGGAGGHAARVLDVTDRAGAEAALHDALAVHGTPDLVVNTAGYARAAWLGEDPDGLAGNMIATDLLGSLNVARAVLPALRAAGGGTLVLTSSMAGLTGVPGYTAYSAAKFGVVGLAEALRREVARDGIRVITLCPPNTRTPGFAAENVDKPAEVLASEEKVHTLSPEAVAAALVGALPRAPRLVVPGLDSRLSALAVRLLPGVAERSLRRR